MTRGRRLELAWSDHRRRECLRIRGWSEAELPELSGLSAAQLGQRLAVLPSELVNATLPSLQPLAGRFAIEGDSVCFIPRFPFLDGTSYSLLVNAADQERRTGEVWTIRRPKRTGASTTDVLAVHPSADELPVNQLKLYVHFSSPMSEGWAARAIHVRRADNHEPLEGVFLRMEPELWDPERQRLTLLLDPGRIKRGLVPNEEAGYPLIEGVPIVVTIGPEFPDAAGRPLRAGAERRYAVGPPVRARVVPSGWRCRRPAAGSTDPLTVEFDRPLDHALLEHCLWVNDAAGAPLAGRGSIGAGERSWRFEPRSPWKEGRYALTVDPRLEDLAGNSVIRVFDRDLTRAEDALADARHVAVAFTCSPPRRSARSAPAKLARGVTGR